ncbi:hypothetical protein Nmel_007837, partial [Mimus melanotis]
PPLITRDKTPLKSGPSLRQHSWGRCPPVSGCPPAQQGQSSAREGPRGDRDMGSGHCHLYTPIRARVCQIKIPAVLQSIWSSC